MIGTTTKAMTSTAMTPTGIDAALARRRIISVLHHQECYRHEQQEKRCRSDGARNHDAECAKLGCHMNSSESLRQRHRQEHDRQRCVSDRASDHATDPVTGLAFQSRAMTSAPTDRYVASTSPGPERSAHRIA